MKKNLGNIFTLAALLMAGAAFTACSSSDEIILDQPAAPGEQVYTLTINAAKDGGSTRALALDGTKLVASWADGDELTVYNKTKGAALTGTLTASDANGSTASFSGALTGTIEANDVLTLSYHKPAGFSTYAAQTGTLTSAAACDYAAADVTVASVNSGEIAISETAAEFATETAALKLTLTDGTNALNATALKVEATMTIMSTSKTVELATFDLSGNPYTTNGDGILYFTVPNKSTAAEYVAKKIKEVYSVDLPVATVETMLGSATITFTATVGADSYTVGKTGYTFEAAKYYATTLTMAAPVSLIVNPEVGQVIGVDGKNYADAAAATAAGTTAIAKIAYVGSDAETSTIYNHGLALALSDVSGTQKCCSQWSETCLAHQYTYEEVARNDMAGIANTDAFVGNGSHTHAAANAARNYNSGTHPTGTSAWFLPSVGQWYKMATAAGGYNKLGMESARYWSSTESHEYDAWVFDFGGNYWMTDSKDADYLVRACLAF